MSNRYDCPPNARKIEIEDVAGKSYQRENKACSLGFQSWDALVTFTRCCGVTLPVLEAWEESGKLEESIKML